MIGHPQVMNPEVTVQTGARLHFGLLAIDPPRGREFGGIGLMVEAPGFELRGRVSNADAVTGGSVATQGRIGRFLEEARATAPAEVPVPPLAVEVQTEIPGHRGLGSGTQLGLAVARLATTLAGEGPLPACALAQRVRRGKRSAVGLHGFEHGGLLLEAGQSSPQGIGPLVARIDWPTDWRIVLVAPPEREGLSGVAETHAFQRLSPMSEGLTARLCRTVLLELFPAVMERDFATASAALWEYGKAVGEYFLPVQQGLFADPRMTRLVDQLRHQGVTGIAQTSWGPTIAILRESSAAAETLVDHLRTSGPWSDCDILITSARNTGADCRG